jgi:hypothetical protein
MALCEQIASLIQFFQLRVVCVSVVNPLLCALCAFLCAPLRRDPAAHITPMGEILWFDLFP